MRRKVIKQGHSTLTITLPSKWAKRHNIEGGDEVEIEEQDRSLIVTTESGPDLKKIILDISGMRPNLIWRHLLAAYRNGYNTIIVKGIESGDKDLYSAFSYNTLKYLKKEDMLTMSPIETINACVNRLIDVDIIDQTANQCVIKEMGRTTGKELGNALRRMFVLLKSEAEEIQNGLNGKKEGLKAIHIIDTNLDKFEDFCFRILSKTGYSDLKKTPTMHSIVFILELIGDEFKKIAMHMLENKKPYSGFIKELFQIQKNQLDRSCNLFYSFNKKKAIEIYDENDRRIELIIKYYEKLNDIEKQILEHLSKIQTYILSLTELKIDLQV